MRNGPTPALCYNRGNSEVIYITRVDGFTEGLKHNQLKRIERLFTRKVAPDRIVSHELARQLSEISHDTGRQIGVLLNRKGRVEFVMVGDSKQIEMPDFKRVRVASGRFRGLRCVHTHLLGEPLTSDDLTDLALLRLDLMSVIQVDSKTGLPDLVHSAHLLPSKASDIHTANGTGKPYEFLAPAHPSQLDTDFLTLINSLETEMARNRKTGLNRQTNRERAILVSVTTGATALAEESLAELEELAMSANVLVLDTVIQRRSQIHPKTVLGAGKLNEILIRSMQLGVDLIVFDRELTPAQVRSLSEETELKVLDRPQLILDIFAQRANSREGKLQVELAQLKYLLPRLVMGKNSAFSKLAGGIGGRGPGETKLETDRRRVRKRISDLEKQVKKIGKQRLERRKSRVNRDIPIISLVGYTNAGKSTLLNTLTDSKVYAERKMFATLDPTARRLRLPFEQEVIINDTVGFIRDLPESLVAAFKATLEEIGDSDLLVHVVDGSNPRALHQIESVESILTSLDLGEIPMIIALNKKDRVARKTLKALERSVSLQSDDAVVAVSALSPDSLAPLIAEICGRVSRDPEATETAGAFVSAS
ncbi:MAG: GTPase HflX [Aridibacter famidurans]|nr:GTPase HflX [Aridibacter famidurans]